MKTKVVKKKVGELIEASHKTIKYLGDDQEKVNRQARRGLETFLSNNPVPFDCRRCGTRFQPKPHQYIFYDLCNTCFGEFDKQKMNGRIELFINKRKVAYFEDVDD